MSGCDPFSIMIEGDIEEIMSRVKQIAKSNNIVLRGDLEEGTFDIDIVKGGYIVKDEVIVVSVKDKPYQVNCEHLQDLLTDLFSGNASRDYKEIFGYLNLKRL